MNVVAKELEAKAPDERLEGIIKLAILAVGGQGGGVLTNWIESLARSQGYDCQATSVAGVAQRTGATIYYIEMAEESDRTPVFALAPAAGDVDIMIAAEMMEAGRSIMRGFVTPDRTTLIASTHRQLAVSEKTVPGDGIARSEEVRAAAEVAAKRLIIGDMNEAAIGAGSVISASLFGALAGAEVLPFPREAFEEAIRSGGKGVEASLRAFEAGYEIAKNGEAKADGPEPAAPEPKRGARGPERLKHQWEALAAKAGALPEPVSKMALRGLRKVVDFQDIAYGEEYLERLGTVVEKDDEGRGFLASREAAKYIANAMAYDDIIRVADIKTRGGRSARIRGEMGAGEGNLMQVTEFLHPRAEEIASMLPAKWGARIEASPRKMARLDRWFNKGRRMRSDTIRAFVMLYFLGGLRGWRRKTRRHQVEQEHLSAWLGKALALLPEKYDLAVEILRCRRLIKGYSDTHARGLTKFDTVMRAADLVADREDGAEWVARLREAALKDENGDALKGAVKTIESFAE